MPIYSKIIKDSISHDKIRLLTAVCVYPRFIHSELKTHRQLSGNSASSRAIPIETLLKTIEESPALPVKWGKNQSGMQSYTELDLEKSAEAKAIWLEAMQDAVKHTRRLSQVGVHKQLANRITEPFAHMETVLSFTTKANFFNLRHHPEAQPEFIALMDTLAKAIVGSTPKLLKYGEWHTPFVDDDEYQEFVKTGDLMLPVKVSVARCARVSYKRQGVIKSVAEDVERHDDSVASGHMSPTEHQATPISKSVHCGNFKGWLQYRKTLPDEAVFTRVAHPYPELSHDD